MIEQIHLRPLSKVGNVAKKIPKLKRVKHVQEGRCVCVYGVNTCVEINEYEWELGLNQVELRTNYR